MKLNKRIFILMIALLLLLLYLYKLAINNLTDILGSNYNEILQYQDSCGEPCSRFYWEQESLPFGAEGEYQMYDKKIGDKKYAKMLQELGIRQIINYDSENEIKLDILNIFGRKSGRTYLLPYTLGNGGEIILSHEYRIE